jgi:hypothetical protein
VKQCLFIRPHRLSARTSGSHPEKRGSIPRGVTNYMKKTVFVIGAGASKEINLPTGKELKDKISNLLNIKYQHNSLVSGDYTIADALRMHISNQDGDVNDFNSYLNEAWRIKDAMPLAISIDNFIDSQREGIKIAFCGKLAIVRSILDSERQSNLFFKKTNINSTINFESLKETWYIPFFQIITENCTVDELEIRFKNISLIIFNYDRCVEHFLLHALQKFYKLDKLKASELIKSIKIFHPYGQVGNLPWYQTVNSAEYGQELQPNQLLELSNKIRTFTEGTDPKSSEISKIREQIDKAEKIIFLGFAFHKLNMELISPNKHTKRNNYNIPVKCLATTFGISHHDTKIVKSQISNLTTQLNFEIITSDLSCYKFFNEQWRSLSFGNTTEQ